MKKTIIAALIFITAAFADIKLDFYVSTSRLGCDVVHWAEDPYVNKIDKLLRRSK